MLLGRLLSRFLPTATSRILAGVGVVALATLALWQPWRGGSFYERWGIDPHHLPYNAKLDPREALERGKARAAATGKMLMVTFGANWCPDCLSLHKSLRDPKTHSYAASKFEMVHIDVGSSARTARVKQQLGVDVDGIPLAMFYTADGSPVCDTTHGELTASRHYSSRQILDFLREVADHRRVVSPDQRQ